MTFDPNDPDGVDAELLTWLVPLATEVLTRYFGLEVDGLDHLPTGPCLLVGNHNSGAMFLEAIGFAGQAYTQRPEEFGTWSGLAHDNIIGLPVIGALLHRMGAIRANHEAAHRAFERGRKVMVFPGGNREAFRPWRGRYRICLGDGRAFGKLAMDQQVPLVPVVFIGGHSGFVVLRDNQRLAKLLRADRWLRSDTWPLVLGFPWGLSLGPLFHLPLPVGCRTRVLPAIDVQPYLARPDRDAAIEALFHHVERVMQEAMDGMATERRSRRWPLRRA